MEWYGERWEFRKVLKLIKHESRVLEIGCGRGYFLKMAEKKGATVYGIDINSKAIEHARKIFKLKNAYSEDLSDFLKRDEKDFDFIIFFHVIEHLSDPDGFIKKLSPLLKKDGLLCFSFPGPQRVDVKLLIREHWDYPPNHLTRWDKKSVNHLLAKNNFNLVDIKEEPLSVLKCAESIGTYIQTRMFEKSNKKIPPSEQKGFFRVKKLIKPILLAFFIPAGFVLYLYGKIKGYTGQAMLVIGKKL